MLPRVERKENGHRIYREKDIKTLKLIGFLKKMGMPLEKMKPAGVCRQRLRHFRLSRMAELIELDERFELPAHFDLREHTPLDDRHLRVCLQFNHDIADKVKESNYHYIEDMKEHQDGLDVVLRVRQLDELLQWVLGWGAGVIVLEPELFRNRIRGKAQKIPKRY